jgi:hypothetical protein
MYRVLWDIGWHVSCIVTTEQLLHYVMYPRNVVCFRYVIVNTLHKRYNYYYYYYYYYHYYYYY